MPLRLDIKRVFSQRSDRVKGLDIHPTEPWVVASLYSGHVYIWNYVEQSLVKSFEITELPVRTAKFVPRKQWVVCGADDLHVRVYNYNTMDKVAAFEAHTDYIRHVAAHPTLPLLLTCSDDMLIKLWDWDKGWACTQVFEGHSHYVMQVAFNPKDTATFASASLDRTVKVWSLGSPVPNFTLEGHERGVNCVDYYQGGDRPYLASGADDRAVKVWDYQTKACIQTLEGHAHNVAAVAFHPELPLLLSGSEDGTVRAWHATTYRLESTLNYGMERVWALAAVRGTNAVAIGYDEGCVMVKLGREDPVASMDASGKIVWARHNEVQAANVRALGGAAEPDGERLPLAVKDLGASEIYPQSVAHSPNGRFVAVCGDGEYVIYTALAWRNKAFGSALEFAWADDSNVYATREASGAIKIFRGFKEALTIRPPFGVEGLHGGRLLGLRGADCVVFYDWATGGVVRRLDAAAKGVYWSETGATVVVAGESSFFVLAYDAAAVDARLASGAPADDDGVEEAFDLAAEVPEAVRTGAWAGDCFIYTNAAWRLNYCVGGEVATLHHLDRPAYLLGYLAAQGRVYLVDRDYGVVPYTLAPAVVEYKTLVARGDMAAAAAALAAVPADQLDGIAKFLEGRGLVAEALDVAVDPDHRFELAVQLGRLELAAELAEAAGSEAKWRSLGELALGAGRLDVARAAFERAADLGGLLLLHTSRADGDGMAALAGAAEAAGKQNVAFACRFLLGDLDACVDLLLSCGRLPEAALFCRTYRPSRVSEVVKLWQSDLARTNPKAAESLADPAAYPNLFPGWQESLDAEAARGGGRGAAAALAAGLGALGLGAPSPKANGGGAAAPPDLLDMAPEPEPAAEEEAEAAFYEEEAAAPAAPASPLSPAAAAWQPPPAAAAPPPAASPPPAAPPPAASPPPAAPPPAAAAAAAAALTAEEEAMLADDGDLDLDGELAGMDAAELAEAEAALDGDDDWGLGEENP